MTGIIGKICGVFLAGAMVLSAASASAQMPTQYPPTNQGGMPGMPGQFGGQMPGQQGGGQMPGQRGGTTQRQGPPGQRQQTGAEDENTPFFGEGSEVDPAADTLEKKRERKPLESYFFDNDQRARQNIRWTVEPDRNRLTVGSIDTLQADFQIDFPFMREGVGSAYLGNLGAPSQYLNFFDRRESRHNTFADPWAAYFRSPASMPFFNVKQAFTQAGYVMAGQKAKQEENFSIFHAQNISPQTGFNVDFKSLGTKGIYSWQATRDKILSLGFNHTGKRYTVHAGYVWNSIYNRENGGLVDDGDVIDNITEFDMSDNLPMRMSDPKNWVKSNTVFLHQSYGVPLRRMTEEDFTMADRPAFYIGHSLEYSRWTRKYEDTYAGTVYRDPQNQRPPLPYYDQWLLHPAMSRDSIMESNLSNRLFVQLQPWDRNGAIATIDGGVGVDMRQFYMFDPRRQGEFLNGPDGKNVKQTEYYAYAGINGRVRQYFDWDARFKYNPFGSASGDVEAEGGIVARLFIKERPISISGRFRFSSLNPSYWEQNFISNHYEWKNSFSKENETRFDASLNIPHIGFTATASQSILSGKVYYGADALPAQASDVVSVTGVYLREDLRIGVGKGTNSVNLNHRVMLHWSTNQSVVPVPMVAGYLSYFFDFSVVKDVLRLQTGVDVRANTRYYAPGYNPGVGQFYNQREKELGEYIWMDLFVTAKWKRMRIILKMQHLNDDMFGARNYFSVPHYPMNNRVFKLGLSWNFYD
ncbi:MAG: putative porin [Alistipes sp.]|jgi:hypothetical protein|nr:putative porin [Alistipes sp.]